MKRGVPLACFLTFLFGFSPLTAQIREYVAVVRPVHQEKTVTFLLSLGDSLKKEGYDEAADALKASVRGGYGSGFVHVAPDGAGYLVTNLHVVAHAETVRIEFEQADGTLAAYDNCHVVAEDDGVDLALVAFSDAVRSFDRGLELSDAPLADGDEVWSAGFPGLGSKPSWQLGKGNVTNSRARIPDLADPALTTLLQHSAQVDAGNSGGPLLVTSPESTGGFKVVGVNAWKAIHRQATNFAIPAGAVSRFVEAAIAPSGDDEDGPWANLEDRARALAAALAAEERPYAQAARFISLEFVLHDGGRILRQVLQSAPTDVRGDIAAQMEYSSPLEAIRMAIAYTLVQGRADAEGAAALSLVSVDDGEDPAEPLASVIYSASGSPIRSTWCNERGQWRLASFGLEVGPETGSGEEADAGHSLTISFPWRFQIAAGGAFPVDASGGFTGSVTAAYIVSRFLAAGAGMAVGTAMFWDEYTGITETLALRVALFVRLQMPLSLPRLEIMPYLSIATGGVLGIASVGIVDSFAAIRPGLQVGFGTEPRFHLGAEFQAEFGHGTLEQDSWGFVYVGYSF